MSPFRPSEEEEVSESRVEGLQGTDPAATFKVLDKLVGDSVVGRDLVQSALRSTEWNGIKEHLVGTVTKDLYRNASGRGRTPVTIYQKLTNEQKNLLEDIYGGFEITIEPSHTVTHSFSAASRVLETYKCLESFGVHPRVDYSDYCNRNGLDALVLDIGGNLPFYVRRDYHCVHVEAPVLDNDDSARFENRKLAMEQYIRGTHTGGTCATSNQLNMVSSFLSVANSEGQREVTKPYCMRRSHECDIKAKYGVMIHSVYDNDPKTIAKAMIRHGLDVIKGTFVFDCRFDLQASGTIEKQDMDWRIDLAEDTISFYFRGESSRAYTHRYSTFKKWIVVNTFNHLGQNFNIELAEVVGGIMYFSMTRSSIPKPSYYNTKHRVYFPDAEKQLLVRFELHDYDTYAEFFSTFGSLFSVDPTTILDEKTHASKKRLLPGPDTTNRSLLAQHGVLIRRDQKNLLVAQFYVDGTLLQAGISYALGTRDKKFTPSEIFVYLRSRSSQIMVAKEIVLGHVEPEAVKLFLSAYAVYLFCYDVRFKAGVSLQKALNRTARDRDYATMGCCMRWCALRSRCLMTTKTLTGIEALQAFVENWNAQMYLELRSSVPASQVITRSIPYVEYTGYVSSGKGSRPVELVLPETIDDRFGLNNRRAIEGILEEYYGVSFVKPGERKATTRFVQDSDKEVEVSALPLEVRRLVPKRVYVDEADEKLCELYKSGEKKWLARFKAAVKSVRQQKTVIYVLVPSELNESPAEAMFSLLIAGKVDLSFVRDGDCIYAVLRHNKKVAPHSLNLPYLRSEFERLYREMGQQASLQLSALPVPSGNTNVLTSTKTPFVLARKTPLSDGGIKMPRLKKELDEACKIMNGLEHELVESLRDGLFPDSKVELDETIVSRGAMKLKQLVDMGFEGVLSADSVLDLGANPGGMAHFVHRVNPSAALYTCSLKGPDNKISGKFVPAAAIKIDDDIAEFDLTNAACRSHVMRVLNYSKVGVVIADAATSTAVDYTRQETIHTPIAYAEVAVMVRTLKIGGDFALKVYTLCSPAMQALVLILTKLFTKVEIVKPKASSPLNSEVYILCHKFCPLLIENFHAEIYECLRHPSMTSVLTDELVVDRIRNLSRHYILAQIQALESFAKGARGYQEKIQTLEEKLNPVKQVDPSIRALHEIMKSPPQPVSCTPSAPVYAELLWDKQPTIGVNHSTKTQGKDKPVPIGFESLPTAPRTVPKVEKPPVERPKQKLPSNPSSVKRLLYKFDHSKQLSVVRMTGEAIQNVSTVHGVRVTNGDGACLFSALAGNFYPGKEFRMRLNAVSHDRTDKDLCDELDGSVWGGLRACQFIGAITDTIVQIHNFDSREFYAVAARSGVQQNTIDIHYQKAHYSAIHKTCQRCLWTPMKVDLSALYRYTGSTEAHIIRGNGPTLYVYESGAVCIKCAYLKKMQENQDHGLLFFAHSGLNVPATILSRYELIKILGFPCYRLKQRLVGIGASLSALAPAKPPRLEQFKPAGANPSTDTPQRPPLPQSHYESVYLMSSAYDSTQRCESMPIQTSTDAPERPPLPQSHYECVYLMSSAPDQRRVVPSSAVHGYSTVQPKIDRLNFGFPKNVSYEQLRKSVSLPEELGVPSGLYSRDTLVTKTRQRNKWHLWISPSMHWTQHRQVERSANDELQALMKSTGLVCDDVVSRCESSEQLLVKEDEQLMREIAPPEYLYDEDPLQFHDEIERLYDFAAAQGSIEYESDREVLTTEFEEEPEMNVVKDNFLPCVGTVSSRELSVTTECQKVEQTVNIVPDEQPSTTKVKEKKVGSSVETEKGSLVVLNCDIRTFFQEKAEEKVAFSHCISANIGDSKHMSEGVAVAFADKFGKPTKQEEKGRLTVQVFNRNHVIGLITKAKHFDKPSWMDYTRAFNQFREYVAANNINKVVMSPMGLSRDRIPISLFVDNVLPLCSSGVQVTVCCAQEKTDVSNRSLRAGRSVQSLINEIRNVYEQRRTPKVQKMTYSFLMGQTWENVQAEICTELPNSQYEISNSQRTELSAVLTRCVLTPDAAKECFRERMPNLDWSNVPSVLKAVSAEFKLRIHHHKPEEKQICTYGREYGDVLHLLDTPEESEAGSAESLNRFSLLLPKCKEHVSVETIAPYELDSVLKHRHLNLDSILKNEEYVIFFGNADVCEICAMKSFFTNLTFKNHKLLLQNNKDIPEPINSGTVTTLYELYHVVELSGTKSTLMPKDLSRVLGLFADHQKNCPVCLNTNSDQVLYDVPHMKIRTYCCEFADSFAKGKVFYEKGPPTYDLKITVQQIETGAPCVTRTSERQIEIQCYSESTRKVGDPKFITTKLKAKLKSFNTRSSLIVIVEFPDNLDVQDLLPVLPRQATLYLNAITTGAPFEFVPLPEKDKYSIYMNSMNEQKYLWNSTVQRASEVMRNVYKTALLAMSSMGVRNLKQKDVGKDTSFGLLDLRAKAWKIAPATTMDDYGHAYYYDKKSNKDVYVDFSKCVIKGRLVREALNELASSLPTVDYLAVSKSTRYMNEQALYEAVKDYQYNVKDMGFELIFVEGVPGGGKTRFILDNLDVSPTTEHIVLTATKEAASNVRGRLTPAQLNVMNATIQRRKFRTLDSATMYLKDYYNSNVRTIFVDEASMRHIGQILLVACRLQVDRVYVCGDRAQIPYFNSEGLKTVKARIDPKKVGAKVIAHRVTHRCPVDVAYAMSQMRKENGEAVYESKVHSTSQVLRSLRSVKVDSFNTLTLKTGTQILVFTRADLTTVKTIFPTYSVNTIAEYQGNETEDVVLIRDKAFAIPIYDRTDHQLVAITRHRKSFAYYTIVNDTLHKFLSEITAVPDSELAPFKSLRGGGYNFNTARLNPDLNFPRLDVFRQMVDFEILIKPAYVVNLTPEDHTVTEIVTTYGDLGYVQAKPKFIPKPVLVSPELSPLPNHHENPQNCIQMFVDEIMPGCSWFDNRFHEALFQQDPLYINCYNFKVGFPQLCEKKFDFLSPSLRTACPAAFDESQKLILKTFNERNGGVPEIEGRVPYDLLADEMIAAFKRNCVSDTELLNFYTQNLMSINVDSITEWITMQAPEVLKIIKASEIEHIKFSRLNYYYYMLKRLAKPSLEPHPERKFASPQAIAYQDKVVNAYISPVVRDMKQRMYSVMRKDKIVSSDMSVADFQEILNHRFPPSLMKDYPHRIEIDISKFDKSQGLLALLIDVKMMELFGVPEEMITLWFCMHITTRLVNLPQKFSAWVHYQRKSGDPMTFLGNTLFLIVSLCYLLGDDFKDMFGLFAGDDSYLFSKKLLDLSDLTNRAAVELNLEMKLLHFNYPYFCSKFLIPVDHGDWMVVPDMWKAIIKLGRSDLVNYEHVEQYRVSLIDNFKALEFGQYHYQYAVALAERYKMKYIPIDVFSAVHSLLKSKKKFADLYYIASGDVIDTERYRLPSVEI